MLRSSLLFAVSAAVLLAPLAFAASKQQTLQGKSVELDDLVATLTVKVDPAAQGIAVTVDGPDEFVQRVAFSAENDKVIVKLQGNINWTGDKPPLTVTVTVKPNTPLALGNFVGDATIGDLDASLAVQAISGTVKAGNVKDASIQSSGSADVTLGTVDGALAFEASGSGSLKAGAAKTTALDLSGSGDAEVVSVKGELSVQTDGSGSATIGEIDGATAVSISGSGDIKIHGGRASAFQASIDGSGSLMFGGTAVNPMISASGSGEICIGKVEGQLTSSGGSVKIDQKACVPG